MTLRGQDGHRMGQEEAVDDAAVEDLLAGRYQGDEPDLLAVSQLVERVQSFVDRPAPPSTALARILSGTALPGAGAVPTKSR